MSTTTILDIPDTQMLDYSTDSDFTMHATGHPSEWLSVEATMSDDSLPREYSETIEIEMDPNDEDEITEYEMADGEESYRLDEPVELEDVDFADPSNVASPQHINGISSPLFLDAASLQRTSSPSLLLPRSTALPESLPLHTILPAGEIHPTYSADPLSTGVFTPAPISAVSSHDPLTSFSSLPAGEREHESDNPHVKDDPSSSYAASVSPDVSAPAQSEARTSSLQDEGVRVDGGSEAHEVDGAQEAQGYELEAPLTAGDSGPAERHSTDIIETVSEQEHEVSNSDPHEISDGVYIDPPPAVLLSISSSSQRMDCCLFNQPQPRSGSQSPNAYASSSTAPDMTLLLSQRPTLYYEPLNNVFETFRQEEIISNLTDFVDGELVLEAYDLDLRIPEENVHAGEVTLHELNVLHDGTDLTGPLRLRLSAVPRFITRYHALREQVAQLTLATGLDNEPHPYEADDEQVDAPDGIPDLLQVQNDTSLAELEHSSGRDAEDAVKVITADDGTSSAAAEVPSDNPTVEAGSQDEQTPVDTLRGSLEDESGYEEQLAERADGENASEDSNQLPEDDSGAVPDADNDHADGGHVEYTDQPGEIDESFGETLPEVVDSALNTSGFHNETLEDLLPEVTSEAGQVEVTSTDEDTTFNVTNAEVTNLLANPTESIGQVALENIVEQIELQSIGQDDDPVLATTDNEPYAEFSEFGEFDDFEDETQPHSNEGTSLEQEPEEWDEFEEDSQPEPFVNSCEGDGLSKHPSETLSTLSKRSRDDEDEESEATNPTGNHLDSPNSKRKRVH